MGKKCQDENAVQREQAGDEVVEECSMKIAFEDEDVKCQDNNIREGTSG